MASPCISRLWTIVRSGSIVGRRRRLSSLSSVCRQHQNHTISIVGSSTERSLLKRRLPPHQHHLNASTTTAATQIRSISLFRDHKEQLLFDERRPWHNPNFMKDNSPDQVEAWLISLLKSVSNDISTEYSPNNPPVSFDDDDDETTSFVLDSTIYLRVIEAYARAKHYSGAPQKAEYWINFAIRHYEHACALFQSKYKMELGSELLMQSDQTQTNGAAAAAAAAAIVHGLQPGVESYNAVIESWANSKDKISVVRSRTWLSRLEDTSTPNQPNARSYDLYLHSVSRGIGKDAKLLLERAQEAERILQYRLSLLRVKGLHDN